MTQPDFDLDLTSVPPSRRRGAVLNAVGALRPGQRLHLRVGEAPDLLLQAVNNHLRGTLRWQVETAGETGFAVTLLCTEDVSPQGVIDLLLRHHQRLDVLLSQGLRLHGAGDRPAAAPVLAEFARALRSHIAVENDVLVPRFSAPRSPLGDDPTSVMLREHAEILQQMALTEMALEEGNGSAGAFLAILSGTLAKHEQREEAGLFPAWQAALERASPADREALFAEISGRLSAGW
ncbi:MAG: hemerythrin domain-containing protein [Pseudomonadota bacterium]|jgi:uncharacterized protein (DUF2249 family)